jgi:GT2 family glycosyltransferase
LPLFDKAWYLEKNPDVREHGIDALDHFVRHGWREGRDPHPAFNVRWYLETYPEVNAAGVNPLEHFLEHGWKEGRSPNPEFDLPWYVRTYEDVRDSGMNPLIHYIEYGAAEGRRVAPEPSNPAGPRASAAVLSEPAVGPAVDFSTRIQDNGASSFDVSAFLPQAGTAPWPPDDVEVDVIVPVYRGLEETRRCLTSLLADTDRPNGLIRVIDDGSPDPELAAWLSSLAATGAIELSHNVDNLGFVRTVNRGMVDAGRRDVLLLNSDTEVTGGFLRRLAGYAYSQPRVATVTPFSNTGGEFAGFPGKECRPLSAAYSLAAIDEACRFANSNRSVEIPTGVGFCLYIRRACLDEVGLFDAEAFGRGYGEETDFCRRALRTGWRHLLACNTFVYHKGEVSFGADAPERAASWSTLVHRHPDLADDLRRHLAGHPTVPAVFAATVALFKASPVPTVLVLNHGFDADNANHVGPLIERAMGTAHVFAVGTVDANLELSVPSIPGHPRLTFPGTASAELSTFLHACSISRVHIQHWMGIDPVLHELIDRLATPLDVTVHDYLPA